MRLITAQLPAPRYEKEEISGQELLAEVNMKGNIQEKSREPLEARGFEFRDDQVREPQAQARLAPPHRCRRTAAEGS
jgi:hypothetical protein